MLSTLARASIDGAVFVTAVWLLTRLLRLTPAARTMIWWCAGAKFLVALVWIAPVGIPILPAADTTPYSAPAAEVSGTRATSTALAIEAGVERAATAARGLSDWSSIVLVLWVGGLSLGAARGLGRWRQTLGVLRESSSAPPTVQTTAARLAAGLGLNRVPEVRMSERVETPLVAGLCRPVVLLPAIRFDALTDRQQQMALCHELAHVKRGDLWLGCVPALAERIFFFHPLAHVAAREYALWREAACDGSVLDALDVAPREYGRLLLDLGISRPNAGLIAAGASWSFPSLKRRIVMLHELSDRSRSSRVVAVAAIGISLAAVIPIHVVARPGSQASAIEPARPVEQIPPAEPATPAVPVSRATPASPAERVTQPAERLRYVMLHEDGGIMSSGSREDVDNARRFRRSGEALLWFRQGSREFVVRDPATLTQVESIWQPVNDLGNEQGKLGEEQGRLGAMQGELGARQGELGAEQGRLGARQGEIGAAQARLAARESAAQTAAAREALEQDRRQIAQQMRDLEEDMRLLDKRMRELDEPMRELNAPMEALSREMAFLGKKMEEAGRRAQEEMRALLERAIATGVAEVVR
jgi:bla regulator protein BlaR1